MVYWFDSKSLRHIVAAVARMELSIVSAHYKCREDDAADAHDYLQNAECRLWMLAKTAWEDTQYRIGGVMADVLRGVAF